MSDGRENKIKKLMHLKKNSKKCAKKLKKLISASPPLSSAPLGYDGFVRADALEESGALSASPGIVLPPSCSQYRLRIF